MFGFTKGGAQVEDSVKNIEGAKLDCVNAVVETLVQDQLASAIKTKVP
jgi:hypothetical protein